ncbi:hypothetical protein [Acetivibrio cellulolyticus]|uniref:hypothetical protein n=1 Tax=Acetivibrio cellulolyticus TaxID=35830 RepID=UPI0001E2E2C2|nr:hypothetical protein [Acetivibrio cellulolyticus]
MESDILMKKLTKRETTVSLENILDNSKADSGGDRDIHFLDFLLDNKLILQEEVILKRTIRDFKEDIFGEKYKKANYESTRHFLCRALIQDELALLDITTSSSTEVGNMYILRSSSNYDIVANDLSFIADIGLTPARNFFKGLTDIRVKYYLITTYFDDYMDDIVFTLFKRSNDTLFIDAVKDYEEGYKLYTPVSQESFNNNAEI